MIGLSKHVKPIAISTGPGVRTIVTPKFYNWSCVINTVGTTVSYTADVLSPVQYIWV